MLTIETVNIADVYPLYDEYGNDLASRDYSTKENQKYVDELAQSMSAKGIPDELVTLVRDGGIYRIKAGNSRVMAMRKLGTKTFPAIVEDESTEQAIIETVVRTNTKKKYSAVEESRFIRQLQAFGDDEYISSVAGIKPDESKRMRRACEVVKDAADDMSLLRLIKIGEYADDPEAVEALTNCAEKDYLLIAKEIEARHAKEHAEKALIHELNARNIPISDDANGYELITTVNRAEMLPATLPDGTIAVPYRAGFYLLMKPVSDSTQPNAEQDLSRARDEAIQVRVSQSLEDMQAWLVEAIKDGNQLQAITDYTARETWDGYPIKDFMANNSIRYLSVGQVEIARWFIETSRKINSRLLDYANALVRVECERYLLVVDLFVRDGYATTKDEQDLYAEIKEELDHE